MQLDVDIARDLNQRCQMSTCKVRAQQSLLMGHRCHVEQQCESGRLALSSIIVPGETSPSTPAGESEWGSMLTLAPRPVQHNAHCHFQQSALCFVKTSCATLMAHRWEEIPGKLHEVLAASHVSRSLGCQLRAQKHTSSPSPCCDSRTLVLTVVPAIQLWLLLWPVWCLSKI